MNKTIRVFFFFYKLVVFNVSIVRQRSRICIHKRPSRLLAPPQKGSSVSSCKTASPVDKRISRTMGCCLILARSARSMTARRSIDHSIVLKVFSYMKKERNKKPWSQFFFCMRMVRPAFLAFAGVVQETILRKTSCCAGQNLHAWK